MARTRGPSRRDLVGGASLGVALLATGVKAAHAQASSDESFEQAERAILSGRTPKAAGVEIVMPQLSENGNSVDITVTVASPMTAEDHVRRVHILAEKNPFPRVATFHLTPRAGRAEVSTRMRLATTQEIVVIAETSRGELLRAQREMIVILGACVDGG